MISNPFTRNLFARYWSTEESKNKNQHQDILKTPTHASTGNLPTLQLERAVTDGDLTKARQALKDGANPREVNFSQTAGNGVRKLLKYARRAQNLYQDIDCDQLSSCDHAFRYGLDPGGVLKAKSELINFKKARTVADLWRYATRENRTDIQRAILMQKADKNPFFREKEEVSPSDLRIKRVMKEIPHYSPKRGVPINLNNRTNFPDSNDWIVCRHLVEHRQSVKERHPNFKFDYNQFENLEAIRANVSSKIEEEHCHLIAHAREVHLIHNDNFGQQLVKQFVTMEAKGKSKQLILLHSINHVMSVELIIKKKNEIPYYVMTFFDPNSTTNHLRAASDSLCTFETMTLKDFIHDSDLYHFYYEDCYSIMFVRPESQRNMVGASESRSLITCTKDNEINASIYFYMMVGNFAGDMRRLNKEMRNWPSDKIINVLAGRPGESSGLYVALQNGNADAIEAFGEVLEYVHDNELAKLIAAKHANNDAPGFFMALQEGHAEAIKAFCKVLELVPPNERAELVAAKSVDGYPGFFMALQEGHTEAIKAFGKVLELVPTGKRAELVAARDPRGFPGFCMALQNRHAEAIKAFGEVLRLVPKPQRAAVRLVAEPEFSEVLKLLPADVCQAFRELEFSKD